jgi:hypothetical protein
MIATSISSVVAALRETGFEPEILPLDMSVLPQLSRKFLQRRQGQRCQHADAHDLGRLLRVRCERPRDRCTPEAQQMVKRGWLSVRDGRYEITPEGVRRRGRTLGFADRRGE